MNHPSLLAALLAALPGPLVQGMDADATRGAGGPPAFDRLAAEHLLNRAAFGAQTEQALAAAEAGLEATLQALFSGPAGPAEHFQVEHHPTGGLLGHPRRESFEREERRGAPARGPDETSAQDAEIEERRAALLAARRDDRRQLEAYTRWWLEAMVRGEDPLRDTMTLFWHGHFTSSMQAVRNSRALIRQHQFLREHALADFGTLLTGILRDPAMLVYLDNVRNRRGNPNENLARELLELFTLGEGNYSEEDVREVARTLTGHGVLGGEYLFVPRRHDPGHKTILGVRGRHGVDELVAILLAQPECARRLAERLLLWFEGLEPPEARVERYAELLRANDYHFESFLAALFRDPEFYGPRVRGARIAGPVELLVGHVRRLGVEPPERFLELGTRLLGQRLFDPPSVQGWEGGGAWITTSSLMQRGNLAGVLVGAIGWADVFGLVDGEDATSARDGESGRERLRRMRALRPRLAELSGRDADLRGLARGNPLRWRTPVDLSGRLGRAGVAGDLEAAAFLAEELLAVPPPRDTLEELSGYLRAQREQFSIPEDRIAGWGSDGEELLRRLAHRILALPEAQLH